MGCLWLIGWVDAQVGVRMWDQLIDRSMVADLLSD